jgi:hypothetical protein
MKLLTLLLVAAVLFGVFGAMAAKARAQEGDRGGTESDGRPSDEPPLPDELLPDEDRTLSENQEIAGGAYTQTGTSETSISMPFIAKISIVLVVLVIALMVLVLRKSQIPT